MKVINFLGGPGCGKSTTAAGLFAAMKCRGFKVEMVTEFPKDLVYEERHMMLDNQFFIFAEQYRRLWRLKDKVDYIITDSPLLLQLYYGKEESFHYRNLVIEKTKEFDNEYFFLEREGEYKEYGRLQTKKEAMKIDEYILEILSDQVGIDNYKVYKSKCENLYEKIINENFLI